MALGDGRNSICCLQDWQPKAQVSSAIHSGAEAQTQQGSDPPTAGSICSVYRLGFVLATVNCLQRISSIRAYARLCYHAKAHSGCAACRRDGLGGMSHRWMKALPISYSLFSGMIGTQSVLFSKALSTLLRTTIDGNSQLTSWFFWLVLVLFLCCAYFWVTRLNKVIHLHQSLAVEPHRQSAPVIQNGMHAAYTKCLSSQLLTSI